MATCRNCGQLIRGRGGERCPLCGQSLRLPGAPDARADRNARVGWMPIFLCMGIAGLAMAGIGRMSRSVWLEYLGWPLCAVGGAISVGGLYLRSARFDYLQERRKARHAAREGRSRIP